jgi:hypothetical protein
MEVVCSSETSVETQRTTRRYIPEDVTFLKCRGLSRPNFVGGLRVIREENYIKGDQELVE